MIRLLPFGLRLQPLDLCPLLFGLRLQLLMSFAQCLFRLLHLSQHSHKAGIGPNQHRIGGLGGSERLGWCRRRYGTGNAWPANRYKMGLIGDIERLT